MQCNIGDVVCFSIQMFFKSKRSLTLNEASSQYLLTHKRSCVFIVEELQVQWAKGAEVKGPNIKYDN